MTIAESSWPNRQHPHGRQKKITAAQADPSAWDRFQERLGLSESTHLKRPDRTTRVEVSQGAKNYSDEDFLVVGARD
jgi:hypothetical protein